MYLFDIEYEGIFIGLDVVWYFEWRFWIKFCLICNLKLVWKFGNLVVVRMYICKIEVLVKFFINFLIIEEIRFWYKMFWKLLFGLIL